MIKVASRLHSPCTQKAPASGLIHPESNHRRIRNSSLKAGQLTSILCWSDKSRRGDDDEGKEKEYTGHGDEVSRDNCQRF